MDIAALHSQFRDEHSPSPQAQIRWLLKQGFPPNIVDQAMLIVYDEVEHGKWFVNGFELDQYLLLKAKDLQQQEHAANVKRIEQTYDKMKQGWEKERKAKLPWYRRVLGG